jgi:hypothetical protein
VGRSERGNKQNFILGLVVILIKENGAKLVIFNKKIYVYFNLKLNLENEVLFVNEETNLNYE